jgi:hypothetical protein
MDQEARHSVEGMLEVAIADRLPAESYHDAKDCEEELKEWIKEQLEKILKLV